MKCLKENGRPNLDFMNVEISDNGIYKTVCNKGHETVTLAFEQKYEILFELGAMALLDGYPREAVSNFASALERFHEYCIELLLFNNKIEYETYRDTWKLISNQSERQLGAFYFLYLFEFKQPPRKIEQKWIEFRNNITHKGYISTSIEAYEYGNYVLKYIFKISQEFKSKYTDTLGFLIRKMFDEFKKKYPNIESSNSLSINTIVSRALSKNEYKENLFEDLLKELKSEIDMRFYSR